MIECAPDGLPWRRGRTVLIDVPRCGVHDAGVIRRVEISRRAAKEVERVPRHVALKLRLWIDDVEDRGLEEVRKTPGYHDEPLKGDRRGQRSIRLSIHYRAIYEIHENAPELIEIQEVTKHQY